MPSDPIDALERAALCDLFLELGPAAPTLCEGWNTFDLAAHLHLRENDLLRAGPVVFAGDRFPDFAVKVTDRAKALGFEGLVADLRAGPPKVPWQLPGLRTPLNTIEWFVHHEDVRRANGQGPRPADPERDQVLWAQLRRMLRPMLFLKARGQNVEVVAPGYGSIPGRDGDGRVRLAGAPPELVLYAYGRKGAAQVELTGDPEAIATLEKAQLGI
jgi:uncharacterized protein (TIGR03085 family)